MTSLPLRLALADTDALDGSGPCDLVALDCCAVERPRAPRMRALDDSATRTRSAIRVCLSCDADSVVTNMLLDYGFDVAPFVCATHTRAR